MSSLPRLLLPSCLITWLALSSLTPLHAGWKPLTREQAERVESLLAEMTLEEKIGQMNLLTADLDVTGPSLRPGYQEDVAAGRVGAVFNAYTADFTRALQEKAIAGSRLGIPLLFGYDVIHGHRTIFPIPLAEAASWDLEAIEGAARIAAIEATAEGLHWTFAPMVDIARDPRWGRVAEGAGEDVLLGSRIARARVRGFQGQDLGKRDTLLACAKHFAAYGAAQAGRDYHTADLSTQTLHEVYLPPFRAALDEGVATFMTAFNEVDGIPATGHAGLLTDLLRNRWGFQGFVVTDYTSINEMVPHGYAQDLRHAGALAARAGVDMDMQGSVFQRFLVDLVRSGEVPTERIEEAARRILEMKARLGLLEDPFRYCDPERERRLVLHPSHLQAAREMARKSMVLLENRDQVLPLGLEVRKIALVGPLADSRRDLIGSWSAAGDGERAISVLDAFRSRAGKELSIAHARGCEIQGEDRSGFAAARQVALDADLVVAVCGEAYSMSGEAASRTRLDLPGVQRALLELLVSTGKPVVLVLMSGRPLDLSWEAENLSAILQAWFPGVMGGPAVVDLLTGDHAPEGRLPVTFPRSVGQVPIFYAAKNTGRPVDPERPGEKYKSRYLDSPNSPLYPFGYGKTYTRFAYSDLQLDTEVLAGDGALQVSARLTNQGQRPGVEVAQLYVRDRFGAVTRPVRQLVDFQRVHLGPGESRAIRFRIRPQALAFPVGNGDPTPEPGDFEIFLGPDASRGLRGSFRLE